MIIGLSGKARVGKDTVADYLVEAHGYKKVAFADGLKRFCSEYFQLPLHFFTDDDLKDRPLKMSYHLYINEIVQIVEDLIVINDSPVGKVEWANLPKERTLRTPREIMQFVGTDLGRNFVSENIWIDLVNSEIMKLDKIVISDARMQNEREFLRSKQAKLILITRDNGRSDSHESETSLNDSYDVIIENDGSLVDLFDKVKEAL